MRPGNDGKMRTKSWVTRMGYGLFNQQSEGIQENLVDSSRRTDCRLISFPPTRTRARTPDKLRTLSRQWKIPNPKIANPNKSQDSKSRQRDKVTGTMRATKLGDKVR